ncbi:HAD domain-containing protein [Pseudorhodoferax sp. Leaf265]|uniref:HAD domain-containing protein n=1 Tax=Pseudorhodoferax sp. Leaf265 TaxID=1736315 RepID=UPI0006F883FF|nr:HAD domain-containing protein [Pseudorhodoferax sp. Leaf265]KQP21382.1 hypothetical protein ASF45_04195 [Pseudorhodoferax sp. Leaf265]
MIRSIIFTDIDDVLVLQRTVDFDKHQAASITPKTAQQLLHKPAAEVLADLVGDGALLVITSNWVRFLDRAGFQRMFEGAGYPALGGALHATWSAPRAAAGTRLAAIDTWLAAHHHGEPYLILDDTDSGTGLRGSRHDLDGRLVLCRPGTGLHAGHLPAIRAALKVLPCGKTFIPPAP